MEKGLLPLNGRVTREVTQPLGASVSLCKMERKMIPNLKEAVRINQRLSTERQDSRVVRGGCPGGNSSPPRSWVTARAA